MNLKRKLRELKDEQEKKYVKKELQIQPTVKKSLNQNLVFIMKGDAIVVFDDVESDRFSKLNIFKKISYCNFSKSNRQLEIEMTNTVDGISDFRHVIQMLKNYPSQYMHEFGLILEKHQSFVNKQIQIADCMKRDSNFEVFKETIMKNSQSFEEKMKEKVRQMEEKGELKFYSYKIVKINTENFMFEINKYYISELFLALLGLNLEQAQQFIMRKGIFDSANVQKMCQHVKFFLKVACERIQSINLETALRTFDGIVIQAKINYHIVFNDELLTGQSTLLDRTEFCMIADFEVSDNMVQQVMEIRKNSTFNFELYENEQDWDYSEEVEKFISAYYDSTRKKVQTQDQIACFSDVPIQLSTGFSKSSGLFL
ncbi:hypothetical protein ABPG72_003390 [Tetrahymena utriculariae]